MYESLSLGTRESVRAVLSELILGKKYELFVGTNKTVRIKRPVVRRAGFHCKYKLNLQRSCFLS